MPNRSAGSEPWYSGVTGYQWLVLAIAAAGWAFDQYEAQVFVVTKDQIFAELAGAQGAELNKWTQYLFAIFLSGHALGGLLAGTMADRFGRRPLLIATILFYSLFTGLTYFAQNLWQLAAIRFLVAAGVGGEWAVAASFVAEVFPTRTAPTRPAFFMHRKSSVSGRRLAGLATGDHWRYAYLIGILPALLVFFVLANLHEPQRWEAKAEAFQHSNTDRKRLGSYKELFETPRWRWNAILGCAFAAAGLATFWAVMVVGADLTRDFLIRIGTNPEEIGTKTKFAYGIVQTAGSGLGLLAFGPISARIGRRAAFIAFNLLAFVIVPITCFVPQTYYQLLALLPLYGFFTQGFHSGYAMYFPELFPTHLRATGTSFCFNGGRIVAIPSLVLSAWLYGPHGIDLRWGVTVMGVFFIFGAVLILFLPETSRQELPE